MLSLPQAPPSFPSFTSNLTLSALVPRYHLLSVLFSQEVPLPHGSNSSSKCSLLNADFNSVCFCPCRATRKRMVHVEDGWLREDARRPHKAMGASRVVNPYLAPVPGLSSFQWDGLSKCLECQYICQIICGYFRARACET